MTYKALTKALFILDAKFYGDNATIHIKEHARQMGLKPEKYLEEAEKLSDAHANPPGSGGIEGFRGKDGRIYKYNTNKHWLVVYNGKRVITFTPFRPKQWTDRIKNNYKEDL